MKINKSYFLIYEACQLLDLEYKSESPFLILGEWCKNNKNLENYSYIDNDYYWDNTEKINNANEYCLKIYKKALKLLTEKLNEIHNLSKDEKYYSILFGNWLFHFIHQLYDKYISILEISKKYPYIETSLLNTEHFSVPLEFSEFSQKIEKNSEYSALIYSEVIQFLQDEKITKFSILNKKSSSIKSSKSTKYCINNSLRDKLENIKSKLLMSINSILYDDYLMITDVNFKKDRFTIPFLLLFKSKFKYVFNHMRYPIEINNAINYKLRNETQINLEDDNFSKLLSKVIIKHIPSAFLEELMNIRKQTLSLNLKRPKVFFTSQVLSGPNLVAKFFLSEFNSIRILNYQHGGGYGIDKTHPTEEYEKSISDIFYGWGWSKSNLPIPITIKNEQTTSNDIVYVMDNAHQRLVRFHNHATSSSSIRYYFKNSLVFFDNLRKYNIPMKVRLHPASNNKFYFSETFKSLNIELDSNKIPFEKQMKSYKLFIFDYLGTSWLETILNNKATIIFTTKKYFECRSDSQVMFDKLEKVGILHYSPESALEYINTVYSDIDSWWLSDDVQKVRKEFLSKYVNTNSNWMNEWIEELNKVLAKN